MSCHGTVDDLAHSNRVKKLGSDEEEIETACLLLAKALLILDHQDQNREATEVFDVLQRLTSRHGIVLPGATRERPRLN